MTREQELTIIRRVQHGDTEAFSMLVTAYEKNVFNVALQMTGNREDAQDMAQEAFLKAYSSLSSPTASSSTGRKKPRGTELK